MKNIGFLFSEFISCFGGKIFSIFEYACLRNVTLEYGFVISFYTIEHLGGRYFVIVAFPRNPLTYRTRRNYRTYP